MTTFLMVGLVITTIAFINIYWRRRHHNLEYLIKSTRGGFTLLTCIAVFAINIIGWIFMPPGTDCACAIIVWISTSYTLIYSILVSIQLAKKPPSWWDNAHEAVVVSSMVQWLIFIGSLLVLIKIIVKYNYGM